MLVEVDNIIIQKKDFFSWIQTNSSFTLFIKAQGTCSPTILIAKRRKCRIGLLFETESPIDKIALVISHKKETLQIPILQYGSTIPFNFKKYKGLITVRILARDYFSVYEMDRLAENPEENPSVPDIKKFSRFYKMSNSLVKRLMYDGFAYTVNPRTLETMEYSQILANPVILEAHRYTLSMFDPAIISSSKEEDEFLKKVRRLRSSPKMFISIFFHVSLQVSRDAIIHMLYKLYVNPQYKKTLYKKITVKFIGELGEDHGALRKEFFELGANELVRDRRFVLENGLFDFATFKQLEDPAHPKNCVLDIPDSDFYSFVGFFLGHVIFQQIQINTRFSRSFYMALLKKKSTYEDIVESTLKGSIDWMRENSVDEMGFVFKSGTPVTDENKYRFIEELILEETFGKRPGYAPMVHTFYKIVVDDILSFTVGQLERLFSGLAVLPMKYLKRITIYKECTELTIEVQYFWHIMENSPEEYKREILRFITGSSTLQYIPGSQVESITIRQVDIQDALPSAHTCFRRLVLYKYKSREDLKQKLELAIKESGGFHFI